MRGRAVRERVKEKTNAPTQLLFAQAERLEQAFLNVLAVDSNAAGAQFVTIQHEVVALGTDFSATLWLFEQINVFLNDAGKWMLGTDPLLVAFAPFKERKIRDPGKAPLILGDQLLLLDHTQPKLREGI